MKIYLYILGASSDPDHVRCPVPWRVDDQLIFFGPCKKHIRDELRDRYLPEGTTTAEVREPIYLVGVNASNARRIRRIVWAGRLQRVMTFADAYDLVSVPPRFQKMRQYAFSPMHVRPIRNEGTFLGYEHVSREHAKDDAWVMDLVRSRSSPHVICDGPRLLLQPGVSRFDGFPRDACLMLENVFFATGYGLAIDSDLTAILQRAQPNAVDIDTYAIFGRRRDGTIEGKTGHYLLIEDDSIGAECLAWINRAKRSGHPEE